MKWLRRLAAAPLLLLALICAIGAVRTFTHDLPDSSFGGGVFAAIVGGAAAVGALALIRPDLRRLRALSFAGVSAWVRLNPLGQAVLAYAAAAILMAARPSYQLAPAFFVFCAYSVAAPVAVALRRGWWASAGLAVLGWCLLFFALAATSESLSPRGFGEAGMVFLLPMEGFPILLAISGLVRLFRAVSPKT